MDRLAQIGMRSRPWVGRVFPDGFGDPDLIDRMSVPIDRHEELRPVEVAWRESLLEGPIRRTVGWFESPYAELLPERARRGVVELVEPVGGSDRVVLVYASWGDESFRSRRLLARILAGRGIASLLFMAPYHGPRRVHGGELAIRTVADLCNQAFVAVREGRSLLADVRQGANVGVTGFSMGAGFSVVTSMLAPFPVALSMTTAAPSPARTFTEGIIGSRLAPSFDAAARARLYEILDAPAATRYEPLPHHAAAVIVSPIRDGFVDAEEARILHRHWSGSDLREVPGGHGSTWVFGKTVIAEAVDDAFHRTFGTDVADISPEVGHRVDRTA